MTIPKKVRDALSQAGLHVDFELKDGKHASPVHPDEVFERWRGVGLAAELERAAPAHRRFHARNRGDDTAGLRRRVITASTVMCCSTLVQRTELLDSSRDALRASALDGSLSCACCLCGVVSSARGGDIDRFSQPSR